MVDDASAAELIAELSGDGADDVGLAELAAFLGSTVHAPDVAAAHLLPGSGGAGHGAECAKLYSEVGGCARVALVQCTAGRPQPHVVRRRSA